MLYGFGWPKTEPDARRLREINEEKEREEKKMGKGKGGKKRGGRTGDTIVVSHVLDTAGATAAVGGNGQRCRGGGTVWGRGGKGGGRSGRSGKGTWVEGGGEDEREERVMDHRTVNRFIAPEEEREVRKRGGINSLLGFTNGADAGLGVGGKEIGSATPDLTLARLRGGGLVERGGSSVMREESVGSSAFEDADGVLRRSKRYFGSRMTM